MFTALPSILSPSRSLLLAFFLFLTPWTLAQRADLPPLPSQTQTAMQTVLDDAVTVQKYYPGIVFLVSKPGYATWIGKAGYAHIEKQDKLDGQEVFRAGSVTKTFTAMLALLLVDDPKYAAKINLDSPLSSLLPDCKTQLSKYPVDKITLRHLLNHTSGIYNYTRDCGFQDRYKNYPTSSSYPFPRLLEIANNNAPQSAYTPGSSWDYSNTNYLLLALIAERVTEKSFPDLINHYLLDNPKINLPRTTFPALDMLDMTDPNYANGYINWYQQAQKARCKYTGELKDQYILRTQLDSEYAWSAGSIIAPAADLGKWLRLVGSGQLLSTSLYHEQLKGVPMGPPERGLSYGLGLQITKNLFKHNENLIGHTGEISGFDSFAGYNKDDGTVLVQLINATVTDPQLKNQQPTFQKIMDLLYP